MIDQRNQRGAPAPGEVWRHRSGHHYVVTSLSTHAETGETLVVCRSSNPPYVGVTYPLTSFLGVVDDGEARFERIDELAS
jgi:hypothetical protein